MDGSGWNLSQISTGLLKRILVLVYIGMYQICNFFKMMLNISHSVITQSSKQAEIIPIFKCFNGSRLKAIYWIEKVM